MRLILLVVVLVVHAGCTVQKIKVEDVEQDTPDIADDASNFTVQVMCHG